MKHFVTYLAIVLWLFLLKSEAQHNSLTVTKTNTEQKHFKKILIVGSGYVETRAFLDMLTLNLITRLKDKNIQATYHFNGADTAQMNNEIHSYVPDDFEAILAFKPIDSLHFSQIRNTRKVDFLNPALGTPHYPRYTRKVDYKEIFDIQLYSRRLTSDTIWAAKLVVEGDYSKNQKTNEIVKKIISSLTINKVLL